MLRAAALAAVGFASAASAVPVREDATPYDARHARAAFLTLGAGARSAALADAFTAVADDATAGWWNPAGLGALAGASGILQHELLGNGISLSSAGVAYPLGPGVAAANLLAYGFGDYVLRDDAGTNLGTASDWDTALTASWGMGNPRWLGGRGTWGISADLVSESVGGVLFAVSLGGMYPVHDRLRLGLAVLHLGPGAGGGSLPASVRAGAAWESVWPWTPVATLDIAAGLGGQPAAVSMGLEARPAAFAALRCGYRWRPDDQGLGALAGVAAGLGLRYGALGIDYAFQPAGDLAMVHRIALVYGGAPRRPKTAPASAVADAVPAQSAAPAAAQPVTPVAAAAAAPVVAPVVRPAAVAPVAPPPAPPPAAQPVPPAPPPAGPADPVYAAAASAFKAGDVDGAWRGVYPLLQTDPSHWQGWQLVGACQYAKGDLRGAMISFRRALFLHPDNPALRAFLDAAPAEGAP